MAIIDEIKKFDTGLTKEELALAFRRALTDYTDEDIDNLINPLKKVIFEHGTRIPTSSDLNDLTETGAYFATYSDISSLTHCPAIGGFRLDVIDCGNENLTQKIIETTTPVVYIRNSDGENWTSWYKFEGTEV